MKRILLGLAVTALLSSCAAQRPANAPMDEYLPFAGPPIDSFHFWNLYSWEPVGPYQVVIWPTPWEAYFVSVAPPCFDLGWTQRIGVTSTAGTVSHFESILVGHHERCLISEIRAIDVKRLQAARKQRSAERAAAKNGVAAPPRPPAPTPASASGTAASTAT